MKNLGIIDLQPFFLALTSLEKTQQSINSCISLALSIINSKLILGKLLGLLDLPRTYALCIYESAEIIMISKYKNFKFTIF